MFRALSISRYHILTWARRYTVFYMASYIRLPKVTLLIGQNSANDSSKLQLATKPVSIYIYIPRQEFQNPFPTAEAHSSTFSLG